MPKSIGTSDPTVTVAKGVSIVASGGVAAISIDGPLNFVHNYGYIGVQDYKTDTAISIRGLGTTTINNNGILYGSLSNIGSSLNILNALGSKMYLTSSPNLGVGGSFINAGYLKFSPEGLLSLPIFAYRESLVQTSTGVLGINLDFSLDYQNYWIFRELGI